MEVPCILTFTALCSSEGEKSKKLLQSLLSTENVSMNAEDVVEPSKVSKAVENVVVPEDKINLKIPYMHQAHQEAPQDVTVDLNKGDVSPVRKSKWFVIWKE